jgi:hypothetical protein
MGNLVLPKSILDGTMQSKAISDCIAWLNDKQYIASDAPALPYEGQIWYDTTNDALKVWNSTTNAWDDLSGSGSSPTMDSLTLNKGLIVNEQGGATTDSDTRIESDTQAYMFFIDASANMIGICKSNPAYTLDIVGNMGLTGNIVIGGTVDGVDVGSHTHNGAGQGGTVSHTYLSDKGTKTHANLDTLFSLYTAKGDVLIASGAGTPAIVATGGAGNDGKVLTASSGSASGVAWSAPSTVGGDHGLLDAVSLTHDDHTQYLLVAGTRAMTGNLRIGANYISNDGDNEGISINAVGVVSLSNNVLIAATAKLYLDAGGDTYLVESAGNTLDIYAGAVNTIRTTATVITMGVATTHNADTTIVATKKLLLTADAGTYIVESADNVFDLYCGGANYVKITHASTKVEILGADLEVDATKRIFLDGGGDTYIVESASNVLDFYTAGAKALSIDASGIITMPLQSSVKAYLNANQNNIVRGAWRVINFNATAYDANSDWDTGNYWFTVPVTGKYLMTASVIIKDPLAGEYDLGIFRTSDSQQYAQTVSYFLTTDNYKNIDITNIAQLTAGDHIQLKIYVVPVGDTSDIYGNLSFHTTFAIQLLS